MNKNFPLGQATKPDCWRMVMATILSVILLPIGVTLGLYGFAGTEAHASPVTTDETKAAIEMAEQLAGKPLSYWLIALAGFVVTTWTFIVKWLLSQLAEQRATNSEVNARLFSYLANDHAASSKREAEVTLALSHNTAAFDRFSEAVSKLRPN